MGGKNTKGQEGVNSKFERTTPQTRSDIVTGLFLVATTSAVGFCTGYQNGFLTYYNAYIDALIENIRYVGNPADCLECDEEKTYEWFYVEPPLDNHLPEEEATSAAEKEKSNEPE